MSDRAGPEAFREACGLDAPLRLAVERADGGAIAVRELDGPFAVIGRDAGCDLVLDDPDVGRRHAYLQVIAGRAFVTDMASRTGVFWGDAREGAGWVPGGSTVRIGPYLLRPLADRPDDPYAPLSEPTSRAFPLPGAIEAALEFRGPDIDPEVWQVSRVLVLIGRSMACRLRFPVAGVSSYHAALVRTASGLWLVDLLSPPGTTVNGLPARSARLEDGDEIGLGPLRITARPGAVLPPKAGSGRGLARVRPPATPASRGVPAGGLTASVVEEFTRMQEQMTDQFQQAMLAMLRMFGAMHQDQMALLRDEMAQLRELNEEQRALQERLAAATARPAAEPPPAVLRLAPTDSSSDDREAPPTPTPTPRPTSPIPPAVSPDIHLQIERRLAAIRNEQQGRLQKLLNSMLGKG